MYASVCVFTTGKINIGIILRIRINAHGEKRNYAQYMGLKICREEERCAQDSGGDT
jgi:hypothetical protein